MNTAAATTVATTPAAALVVAENVNRRPVSGTAAQLAFVLAGSATFTLRNSTTGNRYTFRVSKASGREGLWFASVLVAPGDYRYLGTISGAKVPAYRHGVKSRISPDALSAKVIKWAVELLAGRGLPAGVEFWHEGTCCRCGRPLTDPESIARGVGPVCLDRA